MAKKKWIKNLNEGGLHASLGVPEGETIPPAEIKAAAEEPGKVGKQARAALTLAKLRKKRK